MIYSTQYNFAFVHIPRTAGLSITRALATACIKSCAVDTQSNRHASARELREMVGEPWEAMFKFAVMRSPWRIIESDYRLCVADKQNPAIRGSWKERVERASYFDEFVEREYLQGQIVPGGIWATWGGDVTPYLYEQLPQAWFEICQRIGVLAPLPHVNAAPRDSLSWPSRLIHAVRELCREDFEKFGFEDIP